ncbi:MAG: FkbM family methyltransferase [Syntrophobacteraceae bacterium]
MDKHKAAISNLFDHDAFPDDAFFINKEFDGRKIIIYGAGECCHWFVEVVMRIHGYMPAAVLDRAFTRGDAYEGIPAFSPSEYQPTDEEKRDAIVVICIGKQEYYDEIILCLKRLGFQNIMLLLDVYEIHNPFSLPAELEKKGFDFYRGQQDRILACLELFEDDTSREIYTGFLRTHMQRKPVFLPKRPREEQYFPSDIRLGRGYSRFICCGSDTGDTVRLLNQLHGKVDAIACFEPEPPLFDGLADYLWKHKDELAQNIVAMPCAVFSRDAIMRFTSANREEFARSYPTGYGSRILDGGESLVQCVTLDHTLPGFKPTFICMDVEGAEFEALKGAEGLIRENRPDMGICVYHAPHHLWEIPLYLNSLEVGYRFYLRNHTAFTQETVLYATM